MFTFKFLIHCPEQFGVTERAEINYFPRPKNTVLFTPFNGCSSYHQCIGCDLCTNRVTSFFHQKTELFDSSSPINPLNL